jgi:hypothetical protein
MQSIKMKEELFWDRDPGSVSPDIEIERAINFGGFDFIEEVHPYAPTAVGHGPTASYGVWVRGSWIVGAKLAGCLQTTGGVCQFWHPLVFISIGNQLIRI